MLPLRLGPTFEGAVDHVGEECVLTRFFSVGVPLVPMKSFFVVSRTQRTVKAIPIALNAKSVVLAYARWGAFCLVVLAGAVAAFGPAERPLHLDLAPFFIAACAWLLATFALGHLSGRAGAQRLVFREVTGTSARPEWLPPRVAQRILDEVEAKRRARSTPVWEFVVAAYRARLEGDATSAAQAQAAWLRVESSRARR